MEAVNGLDYIFADHFKPYRVRANKNRFELSHTLGVAVVPLIIAILVAIFAGAFVAANAGPVIAVYAVIAAVMTAIMPTINGLIGPVDRSRIGSLGEGSTTSDENIRETKVLIAKVEIVRGLYAAVAWSVICLCISLVPVLLLNLAVFLGDTKTPPVDIGVTYRVIRGLL